VRFIVHSRLRSHAGTCRPGSARLYVKHDATARVCVCVLVNVSPGTQGNPTDTEGSPDCRSTQGTDTEPQAATFPGAILLFFFYTTTSPLAPHTAFRPTSLQNSLAATVKFLRTLRYLRRAKLFTRHRHRWHLITKHATSKPHWALCGPKGHCFQWRHT
jgi:hypothetical protein